VALEESAHGAPEALVAGAGCGEVALAGILGKAERLAEDVLAPPPQGGPLL
jgi:hypothetical protein